MTQKVIQIGTSLGITIPKEVCEALHIQPGDRIHADFDKKNGTFLITPERKLSAEDEDVLRHTLRFIKKYRADLEELAK